MVSKVVVLSMVFLLAGCIAAAPPSPTPAPTTAPAPTPTPAPVPTATRAPTPTASPTPPPPTPAPVIVQLVSVPAATTANTSFSVSWNVSGGEKGEITSTSIHWDTNPGKAVRDYVQSSISFVGRSPEIFNADVKAPPLPGTIYLRAFATVDGKEYFSGEETVRVGDAVHIDIFDYPTEVRPEDLIYVRWRVVGGDPGKISKTELMWSNKSGAVPSDYLKYATPPAEGSPQNLTGGETPHFTEMLAGKTPQNFTASFTAPSGEDMLPEESIPIYIRAYAVVDGQEYLSGEKAVYVTKRHRITSELIAICQADPTNPMCG